MTHVELPTGHPPDPRHIVSIFDEEARVAAREAAAASLAVLEPHIPVKSGDLRRQTRPRVSKTPAGWIVSIRPAKKVAHIARWVTTGTGIYGPRHTPIRPRKADGFLKLGNRVVRSVRGQRPNPYMDDARDAASAAAAAVIIRGGERAAVRARGL